MRAQPATPEAMKLFHEGVQALSRVEANGIRIDVDYLDRTMAEYDQKIKDAREELKQDNVYSVWRKRYGLRANLGSLEQMGEVLFNVMGHPYPLKGDEAMTKTGRWRTDEETVAKVKLPFVKKHIRMRKYGSVLSRMVTLKREVVGGFFYTDFSLHLSRTYRSSSGADKDSDTSIFNFQNIPIRDPEIAGAIRPCFIPPHPDWHFAEIDFSGIEVRIGASVHKDPVLIRYIEDPTTDMHRDTACQLFFLEPEQVDKRTTRDWSKNRFVFPEFYGSVFFQCAEPLWDGVKSGAKIPGTDITIRQHLKNHGIKGLGKKHSDWESGRIQTEPGTFMEHVRNVERDLWENRFRVYAQWKKDTWDLYKKQGYLRTHTGFVVSSGGMGPMKRNDTGNYDIQGSSFHCLLWSLVQLQRWLTKHKMKSQIVGQIHDSLVLVIHPQELQDVLIAAKIIMTEKLPKAWPWIIVPLATESEVAPPGENWHKKQQWVERGGAWAPKE